MKYEGNITGTWNIINVFFGKRIFISPFKKKKKKIMDDIEITDGFLIAEKLNNFSVDIGPKLASKTLPSNNHYS